MTDSPGATGGPAFGTCAAGHTANVAGNRLLGFDLIVRAYDWGVRGCRAVS